MGTRGPRSRRSCATARPRPPAAPVTIALRCRESDTVIYAQVLGLRPADVLVIAIRDLARILVDVPGALGIFPVGIGRRLDDSHRVAEGIDRLHLHDDAAVRAVEANALLVPAEIVLFLEDGPVVGRLHPRRRMPDLPVSADDVPTAPAGIEADRVSVVVLLEFEIAAPTRADQVPAHRFHREVEVRRQRLFPAVLARVALGIPRGEEAADHEFPHVAHGRLAETAYDLAPQPVDVVGVVV